MTLTRINPLTRAHVMTLIAPDLASARDDYDLSRRLAFHGYDFRDSPYKRVLVTLPHGVEVLDLPRSH